MMADRIGLAPHFASATVPLVDQGDGENFQLLAPVVFTSAELAITLVAPTGFVTDFASTPVGTRNLFPKSGPWNKAAIIHDAGYKLALQTVSGLPYYVTKLQADRLFLEGLTALGVSRWKRTLMYWAVRRFGHGEFSKRRTEAVATSGRLYPDPTDDERSPFDKAALERALHETLPELDASGEAHVGVVAQNGDVGIEGAATVPLGQHASVTADGTWMQRAGWTVRGWFTWKR